MTDPSSQQEELPPPKPPRPSHTQRQLEEDELYARQLAAHYNSIPHRAPRYDRYDEHRYPPREYPPRDGEGEYDEDKEYSFFDGMHYFYISCGFIYLQW